MLTKLHFKDAPGEIELTTSITPHKASYLAPFQPPPSSTSSGRSTTTEELELSDLRYSAPSEPPPQLSLSRREPPSIIEGPRPKCSYVGFHEIVGSGITRTPDRQRCILF